MVRFFWHVEEGHNAYIPPKGQKLVQDKNIYNFVTDIEVPGQKQVAQCIISTPINYLQENQIKNTGVVLAHGNSSDTYKGKLMTSIAQNLAKNGFVVARYICGLSEQKRSQIFEKVLDCLATSPFARTVRQWVLGGFRNGARISAIVGNRCRGNIAGFVFISYPLMEQMPDQKGNLTSADSTQPLITLRPPTLFIYSVKDESCPITNLKATCENCITQDQYLCLFADINWQFQDKQQQGHGSASIQYASNKILEYVQWIEDGQRTPFNQYRIEQEIQPENLQITQTDIDNDKENDVMDAEYPYQTPARYNPNNVLASIVQQQSHNFIQQNGQPQYIADQQLDDGGNQNLEQPKKRQRKNKKLPDTFVSNENSNMQEGIQQEDSNMAPEQSSQEDDQWVDQVAIEQQNLMKQRNDGNKPLLKNLLKQSLGPKKSVPKKPTTPPGNVPLKTPQQSIQYSLQQQVTQQQGKQQQGTQQQSTQLQISQQQSTQQQSTQQQSKQQKITQQQSIQQPNKQQQHMSYADRQKQKIQENKVQSNSIQQQQSGQPQNQGGVQRTFFKQPSKQQVNPDSTTQQGHVNARQNSEQNNLAKNGSQGGTEQQAQRQIKFFQQPQQPGKNLQLPNNQQYIINPQYQQQQKRQQQKAPTQLGFQQRQISQNQQKQQVISVQALRQKQLQVKQSINQTEVSKSIAQSMNNLDNTNQGMNGQN